VSLNSSLPLRRHCPTRESRSDNVLPMPPPTQEPLRRVTPPAVERVAIIIVALFSSANDFRSVEDLCKASPIGLSPATFRRWCHAIPGARPRHVLLFARLLRAVVLARRHRTTPRVWLDMDDRTVRCLCSWAIESRMLTSSDPSVRELARCQRLVPGLLLDAIVGLRTPERGYLIQ
jgi:hypothetical protein